MLNSGHFIFGEHYLNLSNTIAAKKSSFQAFVTTILPHNNLIRLTSAGAAFGKYLPVSPYSGQFQNQQPETAGPQERPWGSLKSCCWRWGKSLLREYLLLMLAYTQLKTKLLMQIIRAEFLRPYVRGACGNNELPELVSALSGLLDVVIALEPVAVACVAVAAAAKAARFCMALRPDKHKTHIHTLRF